MMSQKGGCEGDDHTAKVELMKDLGIEKGERDRVLKVVRDKSISDKHFIFYIQSFKFFDRNPEDNTIKQNELADALRCFGLNPTNQDVEQLTAEFDTNSKRTFSSKSSSSSSSSSSQAVCRANVKYSSMIELSEFISMACEILAKHDPDRLKSAFDFFDVNRDGFISADELKKAMTENGDTMSDEEVQEMLDELDIDNDNKINVHEFIALLKSFDQL
ncbi:neo-calmodulin-like isoform X1 [Convolutriloba macropyga]|uniref:neo-calmodulin-like isoform X1 n=1 Tax=Convolutriloba macropyga TaxID=536237 RepID=UPI003F523A21